MDESKMNWAQRLKAPEVKVPKGLFTFYLSHPFVSREYIRKWELEFEKKHPKIALINPFYDVEGEGREDISIKDKGKKAFFVVNPGTPLCFDLLLNDLDGVLIMSVNPGFAKQKFMPAVLSKIEHLRESFSADITVDGGINDTTAPEAVKAGANILATASFFFGADKPKDAVKFLKSLS